MNTEALTRRAWTDERIAELRARWAAGERRESIASAMGISLTALDQKKFKLQLPTRGAWNAYDWTAERISHLKQLHAERRSDNQIASIMGISSSAVAVRRAALDLPAVTSFRKPQRFPSLEPKPTSDAWVALPGSEPKGLVDLEPGDCRWPIGEDSPFLFCSLPVEHGHYCHTHAARARSHQNVGP